MNRMDILMKEAGLVDLQEIAPSVKADVRYATTNNFTGNILYHDLFRLYAVPELAEAIAGISQELNKELPGYSLVIFDAARPLSVQKEMFEIVKNTDFEPYIANPDGEFKGGFHNYGLALDMSILDDKGKELDMGSEYDCFYPVSHTGNEKQLLSTGQISREAFYNRTFLFSLAQKFSLFPHPYEWWHFQLDYAEDSKRRYKILDF